MTVFQRPAKKRESWCYEFILHGHRARASGFATEEIARNAETVARARILDARLEREYGLRPPRGRIPTLRAYILETYLPDLQGRVAPATYAGHRRLLTKLTATLGAHRVTDITPAMLTAHRTARAATLGANSLRLEFARLRQCFRHLVAAGYLRTSPAAAVGLPRETRGPDRILTLDEQRHLLAACWVDVTRDMIEFTLWTALRPGELCGLLGCMVDTEGQRILVPQPKVQEPKVIPLMPEAMAILLRQGRLEPNRPVFRGAFKGKAIKTNVYHRAFQTAVTRAGLPPIRPYDLRHTCATRLLQAGADLPTVARILGHKDGSRSTWRYVDHVNEARKREVLALLSPQKSPPTPKRPIRTRKQRTR